MHCPHCGCALAVATEATILFANKQCNQCGNEFIIFKNEPMTRKDYLTGKPSGNKPVT